MFSSTAMAGNTSRISAARSGWRSAYSAIDGRSPRRHRATKSSASERTTSDRKPVGIGGSSTWANAVRSQVVEPRSAGEQLPKSLQGPEVAAPGPGLRHPQHAGHLTYGQLLE